MSQTGDMSWNQWLRKAKKLFLNIKVFFSIEVSIAFSTWIVSVLAESCPPTHSWAINSSQTEDEEEWRVEVSEIAGRTSCPPPPAWEEAARPDLQDLLSLLIQQVIWRNGPDSGTTELKVILNGEPDRARHRPWCCLCVWLRGRLG